MVLSVFGDESADETKQRVFAVSGVVGAETDWQRAEDAWTAYTKGEVFHAADWEHAGRKQDYKALAQILAASSVAGVAYAIDLVAFNAVFPGTLREAPYLKCFTRLVVDSASTAMAFNVREDTSTPISRLEFTFDNRPEVLVSASILYGAALNERGWEPASLLASKISFECRTNPRIQMADMIAREAMKDLDRVVGPVQFPERKSKIELAKNDHFRFFVLDRDYFERDSAIEAQLSKDGFNVGAYEQWLLKTGAQDTWDSKVRFLKHFDRQQGRR